MVHELVLMVMTWYRWSINWSLMVHKLVLDGLSTGFTPVPQTCISIHRVDIRRKRWDLCVFQYELSELKKGGEYIQYTPLNLKDLQVMQK